MLPTTAGVEVERPPHDSVPVVVIVPPVIGQVVAIEVTVPVPQVSELTRPPVTSRQPSASAERVVAPELTREVVEATPVFDIENSVVVAEAVEEEMRKSLLH